MKHRIDRKEAANLILAFGAIALIPFVGWLLRPRPLSANSTIGFIKVARKQRTDQILDEMDRLHHRTSLSFDKPDKKPTLDEQWQKITVKLRELGEQHPEYVARAAKTEIGNHWPVVVEKGYLRGRPVWIVVGSSRHDTGFIAWICPPSANDIRQEKADRYCTDLRVAAVEVEMPHTLLK